MDNTHFICDCHYHPAIDKDTDFGWFSASGSVRKQFETLRRAGISKACGAPVQRFPTLPPFKAIRALNDKALALRDKHPAFYVSGIHIHPAFPEESCAEIERCCGREGVRWIGELVGYFMAYQEDYASRNALKIFRTAMAFGATVNLHCQDLRVVRKLCRNLPDLKVVLAHPGGNKAEFLERIGTVARFKNLHLDISGSGIDRFGILRKAVDIAGAHKVLFGTDYPVNNPAVYAHGALLEALSERERRLIFHGNFTRLTGIPCLPEGGK